jgi:DNA-binding XRE family transcriptional regulator
MSDTKQNLEFDGSRLAGLRSERGLRQADVARSIGIKPQSLCGIEKNKHNPSAITLVKICSFFNVKPQYFVRT